MTISIITITFNAEKWIEKTILSIVEQQNSYFEYIIVDGASSDGTIDIIQRFEQRIAVNEFKNISIDRFHWISEPDKGLYDAMNKGMMMAKGDFVWFINAGDKISDLNTLQQISESFAQHLDADIIYGQSLIIDSNDIPLGERHKIAPQSLTLKSMLKGLVVCHQSILVRKSIASSYDLSYKYCADYDWVCNALKKSKHNLYIDNYLSKFMISGISAKYRKQGLTERFRIMKKHFGLSKTLLAHFLIIIIYPFTRKYH